MTTDARQLDAFVTPSRAGGSTPGTEGSARRWLGSRVPGVATKTEDDADGLRRLDALSIPLDTAAGAR